MRLLFRDVLTSLVLATAASGFAQSWPAYRGPDGTGATSGRISDQWPKTGLKELWRVPTPLGFSSFVIEADRALTVIARDGKEMCVAWDAGTGKELWATPTGITKYPGGGDSGTPDNKGGDGPRSTPAVADGRVFVYSADMVLSCLDLATGKVLWTKDVIKEHAGKNISWKSALSPVLDGGLVFLAGGGAGESMLALEQGTGRVKWKAGDELMTHATPVVATLHGVRQVIFHMQSGLVALETASGRPLWKFPFPYKVSTAASPVVGGHLVFCTAGYEVGGAACEIASANGQFTATEVWRRRGDREVASLWSPPVYKDGHLYGMISYKEYGRGPLKCVDLKTGEVRWREPGFGAGNVVLVGDLLIALTDDGHVTLSRPSPKGYEELARFKAVTGKCWTTPAVADGRLYVRSTREGACFELPR